MKSKELPYVVVLDISFAGYGVIRSLAPYNIPIIGFKKNISIPEAKTKLCEKIFSFKNNEELLDKLIHFSESKKYTPVLIMTSDTHVKFFINNRNILEKLYHIHFPPNDIVELLLHKNKFSEFALKHDILIPKSSKLLQEDNLETIKHNFRFPIVLKPYMRSKSWLNSKLPKVFLADTYKDFINIYNKIKNIEKNLLVQEWIPGKDSNINYCLTYFNDKNDCLAAFTGYKIRQWPVSTGSTATTMPVYNKWVENETIRIFKLLNYSGFGSIEFKRHDIDGKYYITEPTVCRLNQQEYVATLNGINIPLIAYNELTGQNIREILPSKAPIIYIDEMAEFYSTWTLFKRKLLTCKEWKNSIKGHKAYRYWNNQDIRVTLAFTFKIFRHILGGLSSRLKSKHNTYNLAV